MTPRAAVGVAAGVVTGTGEGGGSSSPSCADFGGIAVGDDPEQAAIARSAVPISGSAVISLLGNAACTLRKYRQIANRLRNGVVCYCENEGWVMGFTSKPVRVIEIPEPTSEPLLAPEREPQRTEREEEVPATTPA
jgi:hypothetical protein